MAKRCAFENEIDFEVALRDCTTIHVAARVLTGRITPAFEWLFMMYFLEQGCQRGCLPERGRPAGLVEFVKVSSAAWFTHNTSKGVMIAKKVTA